MINNISFSRAETCLIMEPSHSNPHGNVYSGELMKIIDNTAGISAAKHAKGDVVTAKVDEIVFHKAIHIGDILTCLTQQSWTMYIGESVIEFNLILILMY